VHGKLEGRLIRHLGWPNLLREGIASREALKWQCG
jgi:hypothetical protein